MCYSTLSFGGRDENFKSSLAPTQQIQRAALYYPAELSVFHDRKIQRQRASIFHDEPLIFALEAGTSRANVWLIGNY